MDSPLKNKLRFKQNAKLVGGEVLAKRLAELLAQLHPQLVAVLLRKGKEKGIGKEKERKVLPRTNPLPRGPLARRSKKLRIRSYPDPSRPDG